MASEYGQIIKRVGCCVGCCVGGIGSVPSHCPSPSMARASHPPALSGEGG